MRVKTKQHTPPDNEFFLKLSNHILQTRAEFLRWLNNGLITLFWHIGQHLEDSYKANEKSNGKLQIGSIAKQLTTRWGDSFSTRNLNSMVEFYRAFPELWAAASLSSLVTWEHILILLQQKDEETRRFYLWTTVDKKLSPESLRRKIADKTFETYQAPKRSPKNKDLSFKKALSNERFHVMLSYIAHTSQDFDILNGNAPLAFWQQITALRIRNAPPDRAAQYGSDQTQVTCEAISAITQTFTDAQNRRLNFYLNLYFWQTGKIINQNANKDFKQLAAILKPQFGKNFQAKNLALFSSFNREVSDQRCAERLSQLLPFNYIAALLPIQSLTEKMYYARVAAAEGLSVPALKKRIAANEYLLTKGAEEREQSVISQMNNPTSETTASTNGNSTATLTSIMVDHGDDIDKSLLVKNVFEDPSFIDFIQ